MAESSSGPMDETLVDVETGATHGGSGSSETLLRQGDTVGRYVILEELGAGGMGVVHAAYDPELDRKVAIKLLLTRRRDRGTEGQARLLREAQAMAKLTHPNVVAVHDVGTHEGRVFVAMEFVEGVTLKKWMYAGERSWREVVEVLSAAGRGLAAAHASGLVHRDFKPDNVMVADDGRVLVMDFGLARVETEDEKSPTLSTDRTEPSREALTGELTVLGAVMGTPGYMSAEQYAGLAADARSDQFAFGVTLWEALYGQRPFRGESVSALAFNVSQGRVREPPAKRRAPPWLHKVVARTLDVDPEHRWPSMDELLEALGRDPTRARRRWFGVAAAAGLVAAVSGGVQVSRARAEAACADLGASIGEVWNDEVAQGARSALTSADAMLGAVTFERVSPWLDRYAAEWQASRERICLEKETRSPELRQAAVDCLEERRAHLVGLLRIIAESDGPVVQRAVRAAATLPPVVACEDDAWLGDQVSPPDDPAVRERVAALRAELDDASLALTVARLDAAEEAAQKVLSAARETGFEPLVAEAQLVVGQSLAKKAKYEEAEAALEGAYVLAGGVGDDALAAEAATELGTVVGYHRNRHADGLRWVTLGEMLLRRVAGDDRLRRAALLSARGVIHDIKGEFDTAVTEHEEALSLFVDALGEEHPDVTYSLNNLGTVLHIKGDHEGAMERFQRVLEIRRAVLGPEHPDIAMALNNIGAVHHARGEYGKAIEKFTESLEIREKVLGEAHPDVGQSLHNLANLEKRAGHADRALEMYERALVIWRKHLGPAHPNTAATVDNIGLVLQELGRFEDALARHEEALALWETAVGTDHPDVALCLDGLARAQYGLGRPDDAEASYRRALTIIEKAHGPDHVDVAQPLAGLGLVAVSRGRHEEAIEGLERALELRTANPGDPTLLAEVQFTLARALRGAGRGGGREGERVAELATQARDTYAAAGEPHAATLAEVQAFLGGQPSK